MKQYLNFVPPGPNYIESLYTVAMTISEAEVEVLLVHDAKTGRDYKIPTQRNFILGADLAQITRPVEDCGHVVEQSMRLLDHGFENTACMESSITFIDGQKGRILYRGYAIEELFRDHVYEDVMHLILWGALPSEEDKQRGREVMDCVAVPPGQVIKAIESFPRETDAYHMLLVGMAAFGASDSTMAGTRHEQKPVFHGNLENADRAILRTIQ
ncbi:hypothetical protein PMIN06_008463 [Paraphaeosphaeria minitans]|uniref:Citrate synthase n=1 Tax=Paraphaeosphaeria minitans TaxID=565426 RepID=A0A9P6KVH4_9PLEO|nr:citrate synthase [Paraphaeosphaeria minitans]